MSLSFIFGPKETGSILSVSARNVPGVALYMTSLTQIRTVMARSAHFVRRPAHTTSASASAQTNANANGKSSVLPKLTTQGNLLAGAVTRVSVGFILNPFSVLKARFEVRFAFVLVSACELTVNLIRATFITRSTTASCPHSLQ